MTKIRPEERRERFRNAMSNYIPVLNKIDDLKEMYPDGMDEIFPTQWTDALELYGCYAGALETAGANMDQERSALLELMLEKSPEWVWQNRRRLLAERLFLMEF